MAFHYSRFGAFGLALQNYADLNGFVPEADDKAEDFAWPHDEFDGNGYAGCADEQWADHVADAVAATELAQINLSLWQNG